MKNYLLITFSRKCYWIVIGFLLCSNILFAQTSISDYVVFGGNGACPNGPGQAPCNSPGCAVVIGGSSVINGGSVGSFKLVKSTGTVTFNGNIFSGGTVTLANNNKVTGRITAANSPTTSGTILSVGFYANLGGNIDVNGKIVVGSGTVSGKVTHPTGTTYTGPTPGGGNVTGTPSLPTLPTMPIINTFPAYGSTYITKTKTITPGAYNYVSLGGNETLTLSGPGTYIFKSFSSSGPNSKLVFDFKNTTTGNFIIYIHGDISLNKMTASTINGGAATRIYTETHGNGSTNISDRSSSCDFSNGSNGSGNAAIWLGSIWAPYAAIKIGSGTGPSSMITGALWSGTQINIQGNATINYAPFVFCTPPNANAGPDKALDFGNQTTLAGTSSTPGVTFSWQAINGGMISSPANAATITVSSAGTYILTVSSSATCTAKDTAIVTGKNNNVIGSELTSVSQNFSPTNPPSPYFIIQNSKIMIDAVAKVGQRPAAKAFLITNGLTDTITNGTSNFIITGLFPIANLTVLNSRPDLFVYVRPYYAPITFGGIVTSAGDVSMRSNFVRDGYILNGDTLGGNGVKVGIISNSFSTILAGTTSPIRTNTAAQDIVNGDLPGLGNPKGNLIPVHVLKESPSISTDEGRAMLQIVHDVAPKAELYFRTGFISAGDFAVGIDELRQAGCNIIADDITYITEPFLTDGVVARAADAAVAAGTTYFSAAGNFGNKSYESAFRPAVNKPPLIVGTPHDFSGAGDIFQSVTLAPGNYTIVLQWVDDIYSLGQTATGGTKNDLDLYLTPSIDGTGLFGFNRNNTNGDPIEILPFTVNSAVTTNILITNNTIGSNPASLKLIVFRGDITFNEWATGTSTLVGQANAVGVIAVGAARYDKAQPFPGPLSVETFSSTGGTFVNSVQRNKPELVAPDGVNTTVNLGGDYDHEGNSFSNFFGTSAAAPHAAGVAALIIEGRKRYLSGNPSTTPAQIRTILQTTATDIITPPAIPGFDFSSGFGFINADASMRTFAAPNPALIQLVIPPATTPGQAPFQLTVTGFNLSPTSVIYFRDIPLTPTNVVNSGTATVTIPAFMGNPPIKVVTPPNITGGLDGGTSNILNFFDPVKKKILVTANNVSKKYAQQLPAFTTNVRVITGFAPDEDTLTLAQAGLTLDALGLTNVTFTTPANANSDVGTYSITPSRIFDPLNAVDIGLKELYDYIFSPAGSLTIEKLPVTITAQGANVTYGQKIPDIQFTYQFTNTNDGTTIPNSSAFLSGIQSAHQSQLAKDGLGKDILGLVNGKAVTIENGKAVTIENGKAVTIENGQAFTITNGVKLPVVNAQALTIVNGVVTATTGINLTSAQVANLSLLATTKALQNVRQVPSKTLVNGNYVAGSATSVVDITQESILDYNVNAAQTSMLSSVSDVHKKGLVDIESYSNGKAVTIENGKAVTIENGQEITLQNGKAVTIENGQAVTIENGIPVPIVSSQNKTAVIVDTTDVGSNSASLKAVNTITGFDVGSQFIIPGSLVNSNLDITHVAGVVNINPAPVTIKPTPGQSKFPSANDPVFTFTNNAGLASTDFTGALGRVSGNNIGTYAYTLGTLSAGNNYSLVLSTVAPVAKFEIKCQAVIITPTAGLNKVYGSADPTFTFTNNAGLTAAAFTGALSRVTGNNVGTYAYKLGTLSAGPNFTLSLSTTSPVPKFAITKAPLQVKADDKVISKGDALPYFTSTITGLKNGDNPTVSYSLSPACSGAAGIYSIKPSLYSFGNSINYTITYTNGILYINPKGYGVDEVETYLDCVEDRGASYVPANRRYVARFYSKNPNSTPVYVPVGADNKLSSSGSFDASLQAFIFLPGNGTTKFNVPFDGVSLKWELRTYDGSTKVTKSVTANTSSKKCTTIASRSAETTSEEVEEVPIINTTVYPNPAGTSVIINTLTEPLSEKGILLFDINGKSSPARVSKRLSATSLEIDVSHMAQGLYLIRMKVGSGYRTIRFVKG